MKLLLSEFLSFIHVKSEDVIEVGFKRIQKHILNKYLNSKYKSVNGVNAKKTKNTIFLRKSIN